MSQPIRENSMRIAKIIGTVTLNRYPPSLMGAVFKLALPLTLDNLRGVSEPDSEPIVVYDQYGAGIGSLIALSEGPEAAQPFRPEIKPVEAYNAAILDEVHLPDCLN